MILPNGNIFKHVQSEGGDIRYSISLMHDHEELLVVLTDEGIIMDALVWGDDIDGNRTWEYVGTVGMTYDEWFKFVVNRMGDV